MENPKDNSEYLSHLSHEIRTPMNAIVGITNLLSMAGPLTDRQQQFVATLKSSTDHLLTLVEELIAYARQQSGAAPERVAETTEAASATSPSSTVASNRRILLVEDHDPNILIATTIMDSLGYSYDVARNGYDGLSFTENQDYAVILMDVQMKGMDGLETATQLREREKRTQSLRTPIIALTAHATDDYRDKCLNAGMDDYMCKPLNPETFERKIERYIQAKESLLHSGNALPVT